MCTVILAGCTTRPLGSYLKTLGVLRLVSEQADTEARSWWDGDVIHLRSKLDEQSLLDFFLDKYQPTPIIAPWNGGSGFYEKDRKIGIDAIAGSTNERFQEYRDAIAILRALPEIAAGKAEKSEEEARRTSILRACRNELSDHTVEWLDAAVGISASGDRSFAPVLGTGGNEGRLDYTNNFMERLAGLLINPDEKNQARELLANALMGTPTEALQGGAATGQFDPGRAGGANQGQGIFADVATNPWDFVLTLEGAVAWASGLYRRQGVSYGSFLCSPFTVRASNVGYGSASAKDDARSEIWAPLWSRPARYAEVQVLFREGRASVDGRPAETGIQFAEAACSLGVDRGIDRFVRYNLLKRRGDSYVALPAGVFPAKYRSESDRIRELESVLIRLDRADLPPGCESLRRGIDTAIFEALLIGGSQRVQAVMAALGRLLRRLATTGKAVRLPATLSAQAWVEACGNGREVRIAAALASISDAQVGSIRENLFAGNKGFAWIGRDVPDRMIAVLERRLQIATAVESRNNPFGGACQLHAGDPTLFIEGSVDDSLIEDLLFAFTSLNWSDFHSVTPERTDVLPVYTVLKHLFLPGKFEVNGEKKRLRSDPRVISQLRGGRIADAAEIAIHRLRVAGLRPLDISYDGGVNSRRLAAALLIPVRVGKNFAAAVLQQQEQTLAYTKGN